MSSVNTPPLRTAWEFDVSQAAKSSSLVIREVERTERKFQELSRNAAAQFEKVSRSVEESRGRIAQMGRQIGLSEEAIESLQRAAESQGRSAATVERSNRLAYEGLIRATGLSRVEIERLRSAQQGFSREATADYNRLSREIDETRSSIERMGRAVGLSEDSIESLQRTAAAQGPAIQRSQRMQELAYENLARSTGMTRQELERLRASQSRVAAEGREGLQTLQLKWLALAGAVSIVVGALGATLGGITQLGIGWEQTNVSFSTFLGNADKAKRTLIELNNFANETPLVNDQVIRAGKQLLAFQFETEQLIPTLRRIGDVAAGTGKDFNELVVIYGKARLAGTLYAEDINQLVEAGVPIISEFAKQLGVNESQVKKLASEGKISFTELETAFQNLTGEGGLFFDLMAKQSLTTGGLLSTVAGNLQVIGIGIGSVISDALKPGLQIAAQVTGALANLDDETAQFVKIAGVAGVAFVGLLGSMAATTLFANSTLVPTLISAAAKIGAAFTAATGGVNLLIAGAVAAAAALGYTVYSNWSRLQDIVVPLKEVVSDLSAEFRTTYDAVSEFFAALFGFDAGELDWIEGLRFGLKVVATAAIVSMGALEALFRIAKLVVTGLYDAGKTIAILFTEGAEAAAAYAGQARERGWEQLAAMDRAGIRNLQAIGRTWRSEQERATDSVLAGEDEKQAAIADTVTARTEEAKQTRELAEAYSEYYRKQIENIRKELAERENARRFRRRELTPVESNLAVRLETSRLDDAFEPVLQYAVQLGERFGVTFRSAIEDAQPFAGGTVEEGMAAWRAAVEAAAADYGETFDQARLRVAGGLRENLQYLAETGRIVLQEVATELEDGRAVARFEIEADASALEEVRTILAKGVVPKDAEQQTIEIRVASADFDAFLERAAQFVERYAEPVELRLQFSEEGYAEAEAALQRLADEGALAYETIRQLDEAGTVTFETKIAIEDPAAIRRLKTELREPVEFEVSAEGSSEIKNLWTELKAGAREVRSAFEGGFNITKFSAGLDRMAQQMQELLGYVEKFHSAWAAVDQARIDKLNQTASRYDWFFSLLTALNQRQVEQDVAAIEAAESAKIDLVRSRIEEIAALENAEFERRRAEILAEYEARWLARAAELEEKKAAYAAETEDHLQFVYGIADINAQIEDERAALEDEKQAAIDAARTESESRKEQSTAQHNAQITKLEEQKEARIEQIKTEGAKRERGLVRAQALVKWAFESAALEMSKRMQIAQAKIQMAMGIVDAIRAGAQIASTIPFVGIVLGPAFAAKMIAMVTQATSLAISNISSQFVLPPVELLAPEAEQGGYFRGARHSAGGIPLLIEDGEAVLTRRAMLAGETFALPGLGRVRDYDVASTMNVAAGGVAFPGALDLRLRGPAGEAFQVTAATAAANVRSIVSVSIQRVDAPVIFQVKETLPAEELRAMVDEAQATLLPRALAAVEERIEGRR